jgi:hypothetical protein
LKSGEAEDFSLKPTDENALQGWAAIHEPPTPHGVAAESAKNALQGCCQGGAMQSIRNLYFVCKGLDWRSVEHPSDKTRFFSRSSLEVQ